MSCYAPVVTRIRNLLQLSEQDDSTACVGWNWETGSHPRLPQPAQCLSMASLCVGSLLLLHWSVSSFFSPNATAELTGLGDLPLGFGESFMPVAGRDNK